MRMNMTACESAYGHKQCHASEGWHPLLRRNTNKAVSPNPTMDASRSTA